MKAIYSDFVWFNPLNQMVSIEKVSMGKNPTKFKYNSIETEYMS
jgi:hypothetical protein